MHPRTLPCLARSLAHSLSHVCVYVSYVCVCMHVFVCVCVCARASVSQAIAPETSMTPREPVRRSCPPLHSHTSLCVCVYERQRVPKSDHHPGFGICVSRAVYMQVVVGWSVLSRLHPSTTYARKCVPKAVPWLVMTTWHGEML